VSPEADACAVTGCAWASETRGDKAMPTTELHYLGLVELGQQVQAKKLSPVEVTKAMLERIERLDGKLKSYAYVMADSALAEAAAAEKEIASGKIKGPLHGVPVAVKDLCWAKGAPAAHGMMIHRDFRPTEDATVVARLKDAGAIILGKLQQTEGAYADHHPKIDPPKNPWNADLWPGASSSGSGSATAAGLCFGSLGTDTGGSIRFPSAANGITGLKPSWGRVSRYGAFELAATLEIPRVLVPCFPGALSALGILRADVTKDLSRTVRFEVESAAGSKPKLLRAFAALELEGRKQMRAEGFSISAVQIHRSLDMRYAGQSYELNVPFSGNFVSAFHRAHEKRYRYFDGTRACEVVNIRARFTGHTPRPTLPKLLPGGPNPKNVLVANSPVQFHGRRNMTAIYDRSLLHAGNRIPGPAIVTEYSATSLIPPDWSGRVDRTGNLILEPRR